MGTHVGMVATSDSKFLIGTDSLRTTYHRHTNTSTLLRPCGRITHLASAVIPTTANVTGSTSPGQSSTRNLLLTRALHRYSVTFREYQAHGLSQEEECKNP